MIPGAALRPRPASVATGAPAASSTASASALASKASTGARRPCQLRGTALPRRMPAARSVSSSGGRRHRPGRLRTAPRRGSRAPCCAPAAAMRLGRSEGRMSESSDEIGLASLQRLRWPPPKSFACASGRNDQVTASLRPRAASVRRAATMRFCSGLSTGLATAAGRGIACEAAHCRARQMRQTSSTRSASPCTSGRQDGTAAEQARPASRSRRSRARSECASARASGTSMPPKAFTRSCAGDSCALCRAPRPAMTSSEARRRRDRGSCGVAISTPVWVKAGSMPRSKR